MPTTGRYEWVAPKIKGGKLLLALLKRVKK